MNLSHIISLSAIIAASILGVPKIYSSESGPKILGYTQSLGITDNAIRKVDQIDIAFVNPSDGNGNLDRSPTAYLDFVTRAKRVNPAVKVYISLGGWAATGGGGSASNYRAILLNDTKRATFIKNMVTLVAGSHLDGVDVDFESSQFLYSLNTTDSKTKLTTHYFTKFVTELKSALLGVYDVNYIKWSKTYTSIDIIYPARNRGLTAAVMIGNDQAIERTAYNAFDYIGMMSYDGDGADFSSLAFADRYINFYTGNNPGVGFSIPSTKLYLGVPFYGLQTSNRSNPTFAAIYGTDNHALDHDSTHGIYYNGRPTIQAKAQKVSSSHLAGLMIWSLEQDKNEMLINTVYDAMHPAHPAFERHINLGGSSVTFEGNVWTASSSLSRELTIDAANVGRIETPSATTLVPTPNAAKNSMLNTCVRTTGPTLRFHQSGVPQGSYTIKLWMMENVQPNYRSFDVKLEGRTAARGIGSNIGLGLWINYPYVVQVTDGTLDIELSKSAGSVGTPQLMGLEIIAGAPTGVASLVKDDVLGAIFSR